MLIFFHRMLPVMIDWKKNKTISNGRYVESVITHVSRRYPMSMILTHANDNNDGPPSTDLGVRKVA